MANGTEVLVSALENQTHSIENGLISVANDISKNLDDGLRSLQDSIHQDMRDLQEATENNQESEEDKNEAKISQKKQLGVLGTIAAGILAIPNQIVKETKGEGILAGILGNELVETGLNIADKFLAPVKAVLGKTAEIAAPLVKKAGKFGLVAAGVDSLHQDQARIDTPHLGIAYQATNESTFWGAPGSEPGLPSLSSTQNDYPLHSQIIQDHNNSSDNPIRIAIIATVYTYLTHGQHFGDRFMVGYAYEGKWHHPKARVVSMYVDQRPVGDQSDARAR